MTDEITLPWLEKEDAATLQNLGRVGGWAPGSYMAKCLDCDFQFTGDKRARQCLPCAIKAQVDEIARLKSELTEARERIQAILDWADLALNNPEVFKIGGVRNLTGPAFDEARAFLTKGETDAD